MLLLHEGRFATYDVLYYEDARPRHGPFMAFLCVAGAERVAIEDAHSLRDRVADFVGTKGTPKGMNAKTLQKYVEAYGHEDDEGPDFVAEHEDALLHALACCEERTVIVYGSRDEGAILVPEAVHRPGKGRPILLYWNEGYGYCPLVPAATRRGLDPVVADNEDVNEDEMSISSDDEADTPPPLTYVCDICGQGSDIVHSSCTKKGPGCTGAFHMGRKSACQQRYFEERDRSGDGKNRCKVCLLTDGVKPERLQGVGPCN